MKITKKIIIGITVTLVTQCKGKSDIIRYPMVEVRGPQEQRPIIVPSSHGVHPGFVALGIFTGMALGAAPAGAFAAHYYLGKEDATEKNKILLYKLGESNRIGNELRDAIILQKTENKRILYDEKIKNNRTKTRKNNQDDENDDEKSSGQVFSPKEEPANYDNYILTTNRNVAENDTLRSTLLARTMWTADKDFRNMMFEHQLNVPSEDTMTAITSALNTALTISLKDIPLDFTRENKETLASNWFHRTNLHLSENELMNVIGVPYLPVSSRNPHDNWRSINPMISISRLYDITTTVLLRAINKNVDELFDYVHRTDIMKLEDEFKQRHQEKTVKNSRRNRVFETNHLFTNTL